MKHYGFTPSSICVTIQPESNVKGPQTILLQLCGLLSECMSVPGSDIKMRMKIKAMGHENRRLSLDAFPLRLL